MNRVFNLIIMSGCLVGCAPGAVKTIEPLQLINSSAEIVGKDWTLESFNGRAVQPLLKIKFESSTQFSGISGCNGFSGTYNLTASSIIPGNVVSSALGCEGDVFKGKAMESVGRLFGQPSIKVRLEGSKLFLMEGSNTLGFG